MPALSTKRSSVTGQGSLTRLLVAYASVALVAVCALGAVLAITYRNGANRRGLAEGRSEAALLAQTAVEPQLGGRPLSEKLSPRELAELTRLSHGAVDARHILRLRIRDLAGNVVFSEDGSGFGDRPEDEALKAARGAVVARLTHLNADDRERPLGAAAVEVYLPLTVGAQDRRVGVLEVYLPYAPIVRDVDSDLDDLYRDLGIGLAGLYLLLLAVGLSVTRGLRREAAVNSFLAHHDALTGLPNRTLFLQRAQQASDQARAEGRPATIAIVDLDRFKDINDTLGHASGDQLLQELADRLRADLPATATVARLGGDEFGLILRDAPTPEAELWRLRSVICSDVEIRGLSLSVEPSIGFAVLPGEEPGVDIQLQHADVAMYAAKAKHAGVLKYAPELDHYDPENLALIAELRTAIRAGELVLHYQPKTTLATGEANSVEALVRWQHPKHGLLAPGRFLPLAEQTDLIDELTTWVLGRALDEIAQLEHRNVLLSVAVNISARSITGVDFAERVVSALRERGISPDRLLLEVTETALLVDPDKAADVLNNLTAAGIQISLDDFGRGQTSLSYLSALPIRELKIDRSFVTDMDEDSAHAAIVRSVIDLGHNLSMRVVAEGIETDAVLDRLRSIGCDQAQGYLLARPMPVDRLHEWLLTRAPRHPGARPPAAPRAR
jgi:diguanylate cyclase (GGDEF)-like protein